MASAQTSGMKPPNGPFHLYLVTRYPGPPLQGADRSRDFPLPASSSHAVPLILTTATMMSFLAFASVIFSLPLLVLAQHDHMGGDMGGGTMKMYLHFTPGDSVLFGPWIPNTDRAIFGTCVGVFMLAIVDRWFSAATAVMNAYWNKKVARAPPTELKAILSSLPPFVPRYDIPRGIASLGTTAVHFTLMLIVMTQNASLIISIILGLGFGEMLFGRYATHGC